MTVGLSWTLLVLVAPIGRLGTIGEPLRRYKIGVWAKRDVKLHAHNVHGRGVRDHLNGALKSGDRVIVDV